MESFVRRVEQRFVPQPGQASAQTALAMNLKIAVGSSKSDTKPELARFAGNERDSPHG
jgi:hypothetical protein